MMDNTWLAAALWIGLALEFGVDDLELSESPPAGFADPLSQRGTPSRPRLFRPVNVLAVAALLIFLAAAARAWFVA